MKKLYASYLIMAILLGMSLVSCKKGIPQLDPDPEVPGTKPEVENATYFFKGTINNSKINWQVTGVGNLNVGGGSTTSLAQGITTGALLASISGPYPLLRPEIIVDFRTMQVSYDQDKFAYLKAYMTLGSWNYSLTDEHNFNVGTKAVLINYTDEAGKQYTTIGSQSGSKFSLNKVTVLPAEFGLNDCLKINFKFSCKLYPVDGTGAALTLSDAESTLRLENNL